MYLLGSDKYNCKWNIIFCNDSNLKAWHSLIFSAVKTKFVLRTFEVLVKYLRWCLRCSNCRMRPFYYKIIWPKFVCLKRCDITLNCHCLNLQAVNLYRKLLLSLVSNFAHQNIHTIVAFIKFEYPCVKTHIKEKNLIVSKTNIVLSYEKLISIWQRCLF